MDDKLNLKKNDMMEKIATHDSATGEQGKGFLSFIVTPFAKTQSKTIKEQYEVGCRSFDIRVLKDKDGIFRCAHGLWMSRKSAINILSEINSFPEPCQVCVTYEGFIKDEYNYGLFEYYCYWCKTSFKNITWGKFCIKYNKKNTVKVSYDVVIPEDKNYEGGIQGFLPLDGRSWHTYLQIPWLWDRIYHRPHTFNTEKFTFVDFL